MQLGKSLLHAGFGQCSFGECDIAGLCEDEVVNSFRGPGVKVSPLFVSEGDYGRHVGQPGFFLFYWPVSEVVGNAGIDVGEEAVDSVFF